MPSDRMKVINSICSGLTIGSLQDAASYVAQVARAWGLDTRDEYTSALIARLAEAEFRAAQNSESRVSDAKIAAAFNTFAATIDTQTSSHLDERAVHAFRTLWAAQYPEVFGGEKLRPVAASMLFYLIAYNGGVSKAAVKLVEESRGPLTLTVKSSNLRVAATVNDIPNYVQKLSSLQEKDRVYALNEIATQLGF